MEEKDIKENVETVEQDNRPYQVIIEEARSNLFKSYSKTRKISNIIMFAVVGAIVGVMFLIMSNNKALNIVGYSLAGALLLGMILYYVLTRKKMPNKTQEYMALVSSALRDRLFKDDYCDLKHNPEEKFEISDVAGDGVYKDATSTNSRNIVRGVYKDHHFTYGELALLRPSTRKQQVPPLFVGRYVTLPNDLEFDGRFVIVYKSEKQPLDLPNAVEDLVVLEEKDNIVIYGPEGADFRKILKKDFLNGLRKLTIDKHLLNVNIVVWGGHTAAYISYDDVIMSFPFDKPFDYEAYEQSVDDFAVVMNLIAGE